MGIAKEGGVLVEILNETTASGYLYDVPEALWAALESTLQEELDGAVPPQSPGSSGDDEQHGIMQAMIRIGEEKGLAGADLDVVPVSPKTIAVESGWANAVGEKIPKMSFRLDGLNIPEGASENDCARIICDVLPDGFSTWGFGISDGDLTISAAKKPWDEDADVDRGFFAAFRQGPDGMFRCYQAGHGEDAIASEDVEWNADIHVTLAAVTAAIEKGTGLCMSS